MSKGEKVFLELAKAEDPRAAVRGLKAGELRALWVYAAGLRVTDGWPAEVLGLCMGEAAMRWLDLEKGGAA